MLQSAFLPCDCHQVSLPTLRGLRGPQPVRWPVFDSGSKLKCLVETEKLLGGPAQFRNHGRRLAEPSR